MLDVETEDFDYVTHLGVTLGARLYMPVGEGPFPAMVDGHGGAWIQGSFVNNDSINRRVASGGIVVMAIDYTVPPEGTYPSSVAEMNYAIRWLKQNAARHRTRAEWVGAMGTSAGGHLAVLAAMKPHDPRYAEMPLAGGEAIDGTAACVVAMWPVICPDTRYKENLERQAAGDQAYAHRVGGGVGQMKYWLTEEAMADGSPVGALQRNEDVSLPDTLYVQASGDNLHPRHCMETFCEAYNRRGGYAEPLLIEGEPYDFLRTDPESSEAKRAMKRIIEFVHERTSALRKHSLQGVQ